MRSKEILEPAHSILEIATGQISQILGTLKIKLNVDGCLESLAR